MSSAGDSIPPPGGPPAGGPTKPSGGDRTPSHVARLKARSDTKPEQDPAGKKLPEPKPKFELRANSGGSKASAQYAYIGQRNGWIELNAFCESPQKWDWVAAYHSQDKGVNDWVTWAWVSDLPYYSGGYITEGLSTRYFRWQNGAYEELFRSADIWLEGQVNKQGEDSLNPGCYVSCTDKGYAVINWHGSDIQKWDWVGLFHSTSDPDSNYKTYQWATKGSPYVTGEGYTAGQHIRYFRYLNNKYVCLRYSKPVCMYQLSLATIYKTPPMPTGSLDARDITDWFAIMQDQLIKAFSKEPSIFSPGFDGYGDNLLIKNLSVQEVRVIKDNLKISDYLDVLRIYYETYRLAIQIADDGERNAKRHAFWQISLVRRFGEDFAKKLGAAHEEGRPGSDLDNEVDEHNNTVSIDFAASNKDTDPKTAADYLWTTQRLRGYDIPVQSAADEMDICPNFEVLFPN